MQPYEAAILGLVEGLTEYIPVSSTGHLIITAALLGLDEPPRTKAAVDAFNIIIQGGAILAVLGLYRQRVASMIRGLLGGDPAGRRLAINIIVAFLPAAILGVLLADWIGEQLFRPGPVVAALALGGVVMILLKKWQRTFFHDPAVDDPDDARAFTDLEHLTWRRALLIGFFQCIAMWPGTSRSMTTIVGGMISGMRPRDAAEFSFLLGLPTLGGACVYSLAKSMLSDGQNVFEGLGTMQVVIGFAVATVSAALAVKWLVSYLSRHSLALFGWYRLVLSAVVLWLVSAGALNITPDTAPPPADPGVNAAAEP